MQSIAEQWSRAQELESRGGSEAARTIYEAIVTKEPYHVPARLRMSRLEQLADRYRQSKEHALMAAEAVNAHGATRNIGYVTARLLDFAEEPRVAATILGANPSDPHVIRQSPALSQQLWLAGHYENALKFMNAIAKHVSVHPLLTFTRANVLRFLGDMEGAESEYEATLRMSPDLADAHWALATHSVARPLRSRIPRLQAALLRSKKDSLEQVLLCYALFREFDAADDVDEAWFSLTLGAHIMKQRVRFNRIAESEQLSAWMSSFEIASPADRDESLRPIFIVGLPRTGTTLIDRVLSNHPDVESLGERNDFSAAVSEASDRFFRTCSSMAVERILPSLDFAHAGKLYIERLQRISRGARFVIDKNPQNLFNLPLILSCLPNARVVCLRREPIDACFSNFKECFQGDAYPYSYDLIDVAHHYEDAMRWMSHWASRSSERVFVVSYEQFVNDTAAQASRLLQWIGLSPHEHVHEIERNRSPVATASSAQVRQSIHGRGVGAWKRFERHLQPLLRRFGE